jgi:hypothetical protein
MANGKTMLLLEVLEDEPRHEVGAVPLIDPLQPQGAHQNPLGAFVFRPENLSQSAIGIVYGMFTENRQQSL